MPTVEGAVHAERWTLDATTAARTTVARRVTRRVAVAGGAALIALVAVACSGSSGTSSTATSAPSTSAPASSTTGAPTTTTTVATATSTTTASTSTSAPSGSSTTTTTTTTGAGGANCSDAQLEVTAGPSQGAAGHIAVILVFTNTSTSPCQLSGYPGVAGLDAAGAQQTQANRTLNGYMGGIPNGTKPPVVTLTTGQAASTTVEGSDVPTGDQGACPTYPKLLVTPPNTTQSVTVTAELPGCAPLQVHPVVAGTAGSIPN